MVLSGKHATFRNGLTAVCWSLRGDQGSLLFRITPQQLPEEAWGSWNGPAFMNQEAEPITKHLGKSLNCRLLRNEHGSVVCRSRIRLLRGTISISLARENGEFILYVDVPFEVEGIPEVIE